MSATAGGGSTQTDGPDAGPANRLGFKPGMVIQELGWDNDTDDALRAAIARKPPAGPVPHCRSAPPARARDSGEYGRRIPDSASTLRP